MYGLDLLGIYDGSLTLRKAANLAVSLPAGSAVWRAEGGPMSWTPEMQMLAALEYNTHVLYWFKTKDGSKGNNPPDPIEPRKSKQQEASDEARVMAQRARRRSRTQ